MASKIVIYFAHSSFHYFCPCYGAVDSGAMFPFIYFYFLLSIIFPCHGAVDSGAMFSQDIHLKVSSNRGFFHLLSLLILFINFLQCPGFALIVDGQ